MAWTALLSAGPSSHSKQCCTNPTLPTIPATVSPTVTPCTPCSPCPRKSKRHSPLNPHQFSVRLPVRHISVFVREIKNSPQWVRGDKGSEGIRGRMKHSR